MTEIEQQKNIPGPLTLFKKASSLYWSHRKIIVSISTLVCGAGILETIASVGTTDTDSLVAFFASLLGFIIVFLSYIALVYAISYESSDGNSSFLDFYHKAWSRFVPYITVSFLTAFLVGGAFLTFLIPGIIVSVYLIFAVYTTVLEGLQGFAAMTQSWHYVRGDWWNVALRISFFIVCLLLFYLVVGWLLLIVHLPPQDYTRLSVSVIIDTIIHQAISSYIVLPFSVVYTYLMYESLREKKAGPILEQDVRAMRSRFILFVVLGGIMLLIFASTCTWFVLSGHGIPSWLQ